MNRAFVAVAALALFACQHEKPRPTSATPPEVYAPVSLPIGVAPCDDYLRRVTACQKLSPAVRDVFTHRAGAWKAAGAKAAKACEDVAKTASAQLAELGC